MVLWLPITFTPLIYEFTKSFGTVGKRSLVISMLIISLIPLQKLLKFEAAQRRLARRKT